MPRILILGGIGEARTLAAQLVSHGFHVVYSVAGLTRAPRLRCEVRHGGFGGSLGLRCYLRSRRIDLLVDATHPYADRMSRNAFRATRTSGIALWSYNRPGWTRQAGDDWCWCSGWDAIVKAVERYVHPFFTIGQAPLKHLDAIADGQHWLVRSLQPLALRHPRVTIIVDRGPFSVLTETQLMRERQIDVVISKDSGGEAVAAKIGAARGLRLPVVMWARPKASKADRVFDSMADLVGALKAGFPRAHQP